MTSAATAPPTRLSTDDLEIMVRALGQRQNIAFVPTQRWGYDATAREIYYDRPGLLNLQADESTGLVYQKIGHALHSNGQKDPWTVIGRTIRTVERTIGKDILHPASVMTLFRMLEEERVERIQRREYEYLGEHALPRRDHSYRQRSFTSDMQTLLDGTDLPPNAIIDNLDLPVPPYWMRVGIAMQAIAAGAEVPLPDDMPWPDELRNAIRALGDADSLDALMTSTAALVPQLVTLRVNRDNEQSDQLQSSNQMESPDASTPASGSGAASGTNGDQPETNDIDGDGERQSTLGNANAGNDDDGGSAANNSGDDPAHPGPSQADGTPTNDAADTGDSAGPSPQRDAHLAQMRAEVEAQRTAPQKDEEIEFVRDSTDRLDADAKARLQAGTESKPPTEWIPPAWSAVRRTADPIMFGLRKAVRDHFLRNIAGDTERQLRRGRFDAREAIRSITRGQLTTDVYRAERITDERRYDVYLLVDVSSSMTLPVAENVDHTVFGEVPHLTRWMLAARLTVGLIETLRAYPNINIGVGVHDTDFLETKELRQALTPSVQSQILYHIQPRGGTDPSTAYAHIAKSMMQSTAQRKLLIHLTDGAFSKSMAPFVTLLARNSIETVVFTIAADPATAVKCGVPASNAACIDDDSLPVVLNTHFRRMIRR